MNRGILVVLVFAIAYLVAIGFAQPAINFTSPIVLGQTSLTGTAPGRPATATNLDLPTSVSYLQNQLFVSDSNNARVLIYPASSFVTGGAATISPTNADLVSSGSYLIRQVRAFSEFTNSYIWVSSDPGQRGVIFERFTAPFTFNQTPANTLPASLYSSIVGNALTDTLTGDIYTVDVNYNRIFRFPFFNTSFPAAVYGQADAASTQPNKAQAEPDATTLNSPFSATLGCDGDLWVSDTMNNRILHFPRRNTTADIVIGQQSFNTRDTPDTPNPNSINNPGGIALNGDCTLLFVADSGSNRVLRYRYPFVSGMAAEAQFNGGSGVGNLRFPVDITVDTDRSTLWIADSFNNRVVGLVTSFIPSNLSSTPSPSVSFGSGSSVTPSATISSSSPLATSPTSVGSTNSPSSSLVVSSGSSAPSTSSNSNSGTGTTTAGNTNGGTTTGRASRLSSFLFQYLF